jgi:DNA repair protein RecN (Recombination protein N)
MLERLVIHNFAIIDDLSVELGPGLTAVTGETGAGKSILIDALGAVLGERVTSDLVRTGASKATIDAEFYIAADADGIAKPLADAGIDFPDGQLLLTREIQASGRSSARINGRPVTVTLLRQIGDSLVDIHGQSEHLSLLRKDRQREIVDAFGVDPEIPARMRRAVSEWRAARRALEGIVAQSRETAQRIDLLRYQIGEIDEAAISRDEDTQLDQEFARLSQVDRLGAEIATALRHLDPASGGSAQEAEGAISAIRSAAKLVGDASDIDSGLRPLSSKLDEITYLLEDSLLELKRYAAELEADPARLEEVADRIALIKQIKRKYGSTFDEVMAYRESAEADLTRLTGSEFDEAALRDRERELFAEVVDVGSKLSKMRTHSARELSRAAGAAISDLQLGGASFAIDVRPRDGEPGKTQGEEPRFDETGFDIVEFQFAPNAGEIPRPLARIASGGEMARMMLALKAVVATADNIPTLVFDEVDVGVGGRSGSTVGQKLRGLSRDRQVLVISHLPQVAGFADRHLRIHKQVSGGRTFSVVDELDEAARIQELAAMLDGEPVTEASRAKAIEMLRRINAGSRGD